MNAICFRRGGRSENVCGLCVYRFPMRTCVIANSFSPWFGYVYAPGRVGNWRLQKDFLVRLPRMWFHGPGNDRKEGDEGDDKSCSFLSCRLREGLWSTVCGLGGRTRGQTRYQITIGHRYKILNMVLKTMALADTNPSGVIHGQDECGQRAGWYDTRHLGEGR